MKRFKIAQILGIFVSFCGAMVMVGWFFNIQALKSVFPEWVTMKFSTAVCFLFAGVVLYYIAEFQKGDRELALIAIPLSNIIIIFLMFAMFVSVLTGVDLKIEEAFLRETGVAVKTSIPGRPSIATMINFILIAIAGILTSFSISRLREAFIALGALISLIGVIAVTGYILDQPFLYFALPEKSTAMAIHTAILFILWGFGLILTSKTN